MSNVEDKNTRYFIELSLQDHKLVGHGFDQKDKLNFGRQMSLEKYRVFVTKGQYHKFLEAFS